MDYDVKKRSILLRAFAEADEEYSKCLQQIDDIDDLLLELMHELPKEQFKKVEKITHAYCKMADSIEAVACRYMLFPGEIDI